MPKLRSALPVMFRMWDGEVTAIFPTMPEVNDSVTCYAHVGQHSTASWEWVAQTRAATDIEATSLLIELTGIYAEFSLLVVR